MKCVRCLLISLLVVLAALAAACGDDSGSGSGVTVVATTTQVADLVRQVGGDRVNVEGMLRPGGDPHDYEPRPSDVAAVADATVVFRSGGEVDDWLTDVIDNAGGDARVVSLIDSVKRVDDDPHWWQDPRNGVRAVEAVRAELTKADPDGRATFARNAERTVRTLETLDRRIAACVERVPPAQRKIVTTHDCARLLRAPLRRGGGGRGDPLALDSRAGVRRRRSAPGRSRSAASMCRRSSRRAP